MEFMETQVFRVTARNLITDDALRELQAVLIMRPDAGAVIRGSGGVRKLRLSAVGRGKRGGLRLLYYWIKEQATILLLYVHAKGDREVLTAVQLRELRRCVEEELS